MEREIEIKKEGIFIPIKVLKGIGLEDFDLRDLIFVDANIFIDHGSANPIYGKFCEEFLEKVESKIVMAIGKSI